MYPRDELFLEILCIFTSENCLSSPHQKGIAEKLNSTFGDLIQNMLYHKSIKCILGRDSEGFCVHQKQSHHPSYKLLNTSM